MPSFAVLMLMVLSWSAGSDLPALTVRLFGHHSGVIRRVFLRCNSGHYFAGSVCPFDGWSSQETEVLFDGSIPVADDVTVEALRQRGVPDLALRRVVVMEFGSHDSAFDAISPDFLVIAGQAVRLRDVGREFR